MVDPTAGPEATAGVRAGAMSDEGLARAAGTDREAFATLYRRWAEPIYRYCYRRLDTAEAAEDATSQVWTQALAGIGRFHGQSFPAWLFTVAHNVVASTVRRPSWRRTEPLGDDPPYQDPASGPEQLALIAESRSELAAALDALTADQRQVIALRLADLTTEEIARVTGQSAAAIRMTQHRAIRRLRVALAEPPASSPAQPPSRDPEEPSRA